MKKHLFYPLFALLYLPFTIQASNSKEDYQYIVAIHMGDCNSCFNGLAALYKDKGNTPYTFIFESVYQRDSAIMVDELFLADFKADILFSDSLYQKYVLKSGMSRSSVTLVNNQNQQSITIPLVDVRNDKPYLNTYKEGTAIIELKDQPLNQLFVSTRHLYIFKENSRAIDVYDRHTNIMLYEIAITDSIIMEGYAKRFKGAEASKEYQKAKHEIETKRLVGRRSKLETHCINEDTVYYLMSQPHLTYNKYPKPGQGDSLLIEFFTLVTNVNGTTINIQNIENYRTDKYEDLPGIRRGIDMYDTYYPHHHIVMYNGRLFVQLSGNYIQLDGENWALAEYELNKNNKWVYKKYTNQLPPVYTDKVTLVGYSMNFNRDYITKYNNYLSFVLSDAIYSFTDDKIIPLPFIPQNNSRLRSTIHNFIIEKDYLYLTLWLAPEFGSEYRVFYKYNLKTQKVESERNSLKDGELLKQGIKVVVFDPFDPNYGFSYVNDSTYQRIKIF